ncbi:MAG: DUF1059 domain-containing protein [Anaerolineae bacterium]
MAEHKMVCPVCSDKITAKDETTLIQKVHDHARDAHGKHMTEAQIRELIASQRE